jgi:hypothetical protein
MLLRRVGADETENPVGLIGVTRPDLVAVDEKVVTLIFAAGTKRCEVGPGSGLGVALAPTDFPRAIFGRCSRFCSSVAYSSSTGPSIHNPKEKSGGLARIRAISCDRTRASSVDSPPPPYSFGQVGAVQRRSAIRSSQSLASGFR